jgi:hypothetical protein
MESNQTKDKGAHWSSKAATNASERFIELSIFVALKLAQAQIDKGLVSKAMAELLGFPYDTVLEMLAGGYSFTFRQIARIEEKLEIEILKIDMTPFLASSTTHGKVDEN